MKSIQGTKTEQNLLKAFAGESHNQRFDKQWRQDCED